MARARGVPVPVQAPAPGREPSVPATPSLGGAPLPGALRARMEGALGHDFRHVRVHSDPAAARLVSRLGGEAVTRGHRVFLGSRIRLATTPSDGGVLAHELVHVAQYDQGRVPAGRTPLPSHHPLEAEAARVGKGTGPRSRGRFHPAPSSRPPSSPPALLRHDYTDEELVVILRDELGLRGPEGATLTAAHLTSAGLRDAPPRGLTHSDIRVAVATLRGAGSGVRRGWNGNQDDLGWPSASNTRGRYPTPLHYGLALSRLSVAAGAPGSTEAERSGAYAHFTSRIAVRARLAGAPMRIHPRAVYFVAAAQLEMDRASDTPKGSHYLSPPALRGAFRDLQRRARGQRRRLEPRRPRRRRRGTAPAPAPLRPDLGSEELAAILADALQLVAASREFRRVNQERRAAGQSEELDEPLVDWLLGPEAGDPGDPGGPGDPAAATSAAPAAVLAGWEAAPPTDAAARAARLDELQALLAGAPGRAHGMGALDAHGTHHAMGLAIDYGTAGRSSAENRGVPSSYWPFLYHVMDRWAPDGGAGRWEPGRPRAIHEMEGQARDLSGILQAHGAEVFEEIAGEPLERGSEPAAPGSTVATAPIPTGTAARDLRRARGARVRAVRAQLRVVQQSLRLLLGRGSALQRMEPEPRHHLRSALAGREEAVRADIRGADTYSPVDLEDRLREHRQALQALQAELEGAYTTVEPPEPSAPIPAPAGRGRDPRARRQAAADARRFRRETGVRSRFLSERSRALSMDAQLGPVPVHPDAEALWQSDALAGLRRIVREGGFRRWLRHVVNHGLYTQSEIYEEGVRAVRSHPSRASAEAGESRFYGAHHWDIAPDEILTSEAAYRAAVERERRSRDSADIPLILDIIREWPGGEELIRTDPVLRELAGGEGGAAPEP